MSETEKKICCVVFSLIIGLITFAVPLMACRTFSVPVVGFGITIDFIVSVLVTLIVYNELRD